MTIYTMCIDPQSGKYLAVSAHDARVRAVSYTSSLAAVGMLVTSVTCGGEPITIEAIQEVDTTGL